MKNAALIHIRSISACGSVFFAELFRSDCAGEFLTKVAHLSVICLIPPATKAPCTSLTIHTRISAISIATTASAMDIRFDHPQRPVHLEAGQQTDFSRALISLIVP
ncbi:hypothetical protein JFV28_30100 [Pseudomonas sp. TH05]|uniref:hypothetical protein n=1 Tax=unclassified Pseudomonas TaxID=196821 RepID=UPI00191221DA|nr:MULTISPECIES: hypothetical protein [unclassified Pseudomonas]MBK5538952.1 hypothetical protein [Pseudomonas sp. TH07]MBK5560069.1 hypothetical protein [Pseudomonas sp. TH05]